MGIVSYEVANLFGALFFLFCSTIGLLVIIDTVLMRSFLPTCKSIGRSITRVHRGTRRNVAKPKTTPRILVAQVHTDKPNGKAVPV